MSEPLSLGLLGRVLLRYWVLTLVCLILGAAGAFGSTRLMQPVYEATATQLVKGVPGTGAAANYEAAQFAVSRAKSYPAFLYSAAVLEAVRSDLGNKKSISDLRQSLTADNPADTPLIQVSASANTAAEARDEANSAARHLARFITQIETVSGKSPIIVETAVQASLPTEPISPQVSLITALGAVIGFVVGSSIALIHYFSRSAGVSRRRPRSTEPPTWETDTDEAGTTSVGSDRQGDEAETVTVSAADRRTAAERSRSDPVEVRPRS